MKRKDKHITMVDVELVNAYREHKRRANKVLGLGDETRIIVRSVEEFLEAVKKGLKRGSLIVWDERVEAKKDYYEPTNLCPHLHRCSSQGLKCFSCRNKKEPSPFSIGVTSIKSPFPPYDGTIFDPHGLLPREDIRHRRIQVP